MEKGHSGMMKQFCIEENKRDLIRCCRESVKDEKSLTGHVSPFFPVFRVLFTEKKESV